MNNLGETAHQFAQSQMVATQNCICGRPHKFCFKLYTGGMEDATLTDFGLCKSCLQKSVSEILTMVAELMMAEGNQNSSNS